jgi:hypothetical protein
MFPFNSQSYSNLFLIASSKDELDSFGFGVGKYFVLNPEWQEHSPYFNWTEHVLPALDIVGPAKWISLVENLFSAMEESSVCDRGERNYYLVAHVFYALLTRDRFDSSSSLQHCLVRAMNVAFRSPLSFTSNGQDRIDTVKNLLSRFATNSGLSSEFLELLQELPK